MFRLIDIEKGMTSDKLLFAHLLDRHQKIQAKEQDLKALHR
jgi:hypothetical protein